MRKLLLVLAFAGVVLCQSLEASTSDSDVEELEEPQVEKDTKKEEFKKKMAEVKKNVTRIISDLPDALAKQSAIIENEKLTRKEKHQELIKLVKERPRLYRALKAIFHIVRPMYGPRYLTPRRLSDDGHVPKPLKLSGMHKMTGPKEEDKKAEKPVESKKTEVPSKA